MVKRTEYDTFGNIVDDSDPLFDIPFGFAGGLHDRDTGLVRFGFRDYDSDIRRWTAKDPIGFAGGDTDLFGYCFNDPVNFIDPTGKAAWIPILFAIGAAIESALSISDVASTAHTLMDENATTSDKITSVGLTGIGFLPDVSGLSTVKCASKNLIKRGITAKDLGIKGDLLKSLQGTFRLKGNGSAVFKIDHIGGKTGSNAKHIIDSLIKTAREAGAKKVVIEGNVVNQKLKSVLTKRYGFQTRGNRTWIEINF